MDDDEIVMDELTFTDETGKAHHYGWRVRRVGTGPEAFYVDVLTMGFTYRVVLTNKDLADRYGMQGSYNGHGWCYPKALGFHTVTEAVLTWDLDPTNPTPPPGEWVKDTATGAYRVPGIGQRGVDA